MFDFGKLLKGMVSPKLAISLLTDKIVSTLGHEVDRYVLQMSVPTKEVVFDVEWPDRLGERPERYKATGKHKYKLDDGESLISAFSSVASTKLEKGTTIDFIFMDYDDFGKIKITIAYRNSENVKQKKSIEL